MEWDNESIVKQLQAGQGNREELLERLWTDNLGLIRKIIHRLTGLQYGYPPVPYKSQERMAGKGENSKRPVIINAANLILQIALIAIIIRNNRKRK